MAKRPATKEASRASYWLLFCFISSFQKLLVQDGQPSKKNRSGPGVADAAKVLTGKCYWVSVSIFNLRKCFTRQVGARSTENKDEAGNSAMLAGFLVRAGAIERDACGRIFCSCQGFVTVYALSCFCWQDCKATEADLFPDSNTYRTVSVAGDPSPLQFAERLIASAKAAGAGCKSSWPGVRVCTEFSGSGCAEVTLEGIASHLGVEKVEIGYSADVDRGCRQVLSNTCAGLSLTVRSVVSLKVGPVCLGTFWSSCPTM